MFTQTTATKPLSRRQDHFVVLSAADLRSGVHRDEPALCRLESSAAKGLMEGLDQDIKTLRRGRGHLGRLLLLTGLFFMFAHSRLFFGWECRGGLSALLMLSCILQLRLLITRYTSHLATRRRIKNELLLLQKYASAHRVGMLIDAMRYGDGEASCLAQHLLVETLPHVSDDCSLTRAQHAALCRVLDGTNANLILAVLAVFQRIGIPQSLRAVERMMWCPVWLADAQQIETAAKACYLAMQERADRQAMTETYLRPAAPDTAQILLRPVAFVSCRDECDVKQLVRASAKGEIRPL